MISFIEVMDRMKIILEDEKGSPVFLNDIGRELNISDTTIYNMSRRDRLPFEDLLIYAMRNNISASWLFFGIGNKNVTNINELINTEVDICNNSLIKIKGMIK